MVQSAWSKQPTNIIHYLAKHFMNKIKHVSNIILVLLASAALASCSGNSGPTQPTGSNGSVSNRYVGEAYGGGVVFQTWKDSRGAEHGLVVSIRNQSDGCEWSNLSNNIGSFAGASSHFDGKANTAAVIAQPGHLTSAALLCDQYSVGGYDDWYLPTLQELGTLYMNAPIVNSALASINGASPIKRFLFWSSVELGDSSYAIVGVFIDGQVLFQTKGNSYSVRAVRSF